MTKPKAIKVGQVYRCRDERHGKRWVRIEQIKAATRFFGDYYLPKRVRVSVRRGKSSTWIKSDRTIALSRFNDGKGDYVLVEPK